VIIFYGLRGRNRKHWTFSGNSTFYGVPAGRLCCTFEADAPVQIARPLQDWDYPRRLRTWAFSKRHHDSIERGIAVDEVDTLEPDAQAAVVTHQTMKAGAAEQALRVTTKFDHHEF
jgi:hypothetical protein